LKTTRPWSSGAARPDLTSSSSITAFVSILRPKMTRSQPWRPKLT
jgi:hypothetical protein